MMIPTDFRWSALAPARRPLNMLLRTRIVSAMCTPRTVDDYLELLDASWSVREVRARIVRVQPEAGGATSLWLRPNEHWRGFRAGQFVSMTACVGGVRLTRCFSISSAPEDGLPLRITIKELPGGRVGSWAAHAARPGDVVEIGQARGEFVLPAPLPPRLLFIAGGSGITPIAAMVRHLLATGYGGAIACLHYYRDEPALGGELTALACRHAQLRFVAVPTAQRAPATPLLQGHVSIEHLASVAPWWTDCELFVCGPAALEAQVTQLAQAHGLPGRLHVERFVSAVPLPAAATPLRHRLTFANSGLAVDGSAAASLLDQAERAGLSPAYGCRMGICHSCKCTKLSGVVRNELTGAVSSEPNEEIQLCMSTPRSDVTLAL